MDERARKNAEMPAFNSNNGAGGRTRTYEARSARDLQSLVIATRRLQQYVNYYNRPVLINQYLNPLSAGVGFDYLGASFSLSWGFGTTGGPGAN